MDKRDNKILEILQRNCRVSLKDLSREIYVSNQAVHERLKQLERDKILSYFTIINYFQMGYNNLHLYLKIQGLDERSYNKKILDLDKIKNITWIADFIGDFDLGLSIFYKSISELESVLKKIYKVFYGRIKRKETHLILKQLSSINDPRTLKKNYLEIKKIGNICPVLSDIDIKILKAIQSSARFNYVDVSKKVGLTRRAVKDHINFLEKNKIILGYKPLLDYNSLGYLWNICMLRISLGADYNKVVESLLFSRRVPFISITAEGNILFDLNSSSYSEMKSFINGLKLKYEKEIDEYVLLNVNKIYKFKDI